MKELIPRKQHKQIIKALVILSFIMVTQSRQSLLAAQKIHINLPVSMHQTPYFCCCIASCSANANRIKYVSCPKPYPKTSKSTKNSLIMENKISLVLNAKYNTHDTTPSYDILILFICGAETMKMKPLQKISDTQRETLELAKDLLQ